MNKHIQYIVESYINNELYEEHPLITSNVNIVITELLKIFKNINTDISILLEPNNLFSNNSLLLVYRNITTYSAWIIIELYIYSIIRSLNTSSYFSNTTIVNKTFDIDTNFNIKHQTIPVLLEIKTTLENDIKLTDKQFLEKDEPLYLVCKYSLKNVNTIHINEINLILGSDIKNNITTKGTLALSKVKTYKIY